MLPFLKTHLSIIKKEEMKNSSSQGEKHLIAYDLSLPNQDPTIGDDISE